MLPEPQCGTPPSDASSSTWRQAVDQEIQALGLAPHTRIDQPEEDLTIYVIEAVAPHDMTFRPEGPATFSLSVFLDGRGTVSVDGAKPFRVEPGNAVLFTSRRFASGENTVPGGQHVHLVDLRFETRFLLKAGGPALAQLGGDLLSEHSVPEQEVILVGFPAPAALLQAAIDIASCSITDGLSRRLHLQSKAIECLSLVVTALSTGSSNRTTMRPDDRARIERAQQLIATRYDQNWTIARLSREVGLNERKLKQGFRHLVGNSVHSYLRKVRLDVAASLLQDGSSVTQAALAVGFDNLSHFSKVFSAAKGVSPSRYARHA